MSSTVIEQIKERLSIVDVVSQYVNLTKAGKNYKGISPFNAEKTPSFFVSPDRNAYYCFSSGKGGDVFSFVQEMEGLDFRGALKVLAERAGVELVPEPKEKKDARERMYAMLQAATEWFATQLDSRPDARAYLEGRGLATSSITGWQLGYAPNSWQHVSEFLKGQGYTDYEIETIGLTKKGERGSWYERFRGRILFPIFDSAGRPVAFSGRFFEGDEKEAAKYLNSPETPLFDKSRILYGYDRAKQLMRKYDFAIVVEGQMDLVLSHQMGFSNTVAVSGTGLTDAHLGLIARLTNNIVMAFDADNAGIKSAGRGATLALSRGMDVKIARLPAGKDPADLIKEDATQWKTAIRDSLPLVDFYLAVFQEQAKDSGKFSRMVRSDVLPVVAKIPHAIERAQVASRVAVALGVPVEAVLDELTPHLGNRPEGNASQQSAKQSTPHTGTTNGATQKPATRQGGRYEALLRSLVGVLWWTDTQGEADTTGVQELRSRIEAVIGVDAMERAIEQYTPEREKLLFEVDAMLADDTTITALRERIGRECLHESAKQESIRLAQRLQEAEQSGTPEEVDMLLRKAQELARMIQDTT